jgi:hypothetical protein
LFNVMLRKEQVLQKVLQFRAQLFNSRSLLQCCNHVLQTMSCSSVGRERRAHLPWRPVPGKQRQPCKGLERAVHIGEVTGSSPVKTTKNGQFYPK